MRKWSMDHTKGLLIGILTPLLFVPIVLFFIAFTQDYYFEYLWSKLKSSRYLL